MSIEQEFYPPRNWQDFELLCLKLWEQLWEIPNELDFNSTNQQGQNGVDIVGIPKATKEYCGIQCKNRALHFRYGEQNKLSKSELINEINKAKTFNPPLAKLVIATSLYRDKEIEEFIRIKNLEHLESGLFKIQICFWDYISRNIQDYDRVANWYLKKQDKLSRFSVEVTFDNGEKHLTHNPEFIKTFVQFRTETEEEKKQEEEYRSGIVMQIDEMVRNESFLTRTLHKLVKLFTTNNSSKRAPLEKTVLMIDGKIVNPRYPREKLNLERPKQPKSSSSLFPQIKNYIDDDQELRFHLKIHNNGYETIEDYKLKFQVSGNYKDFQVINPTITQVFDKNRPPWGTYVDQGFGLFEPDEDVLVQKDYSISKQLILTPQLDSDEEISIEWELLSRDFNSKGNLLITISPRYIEKERIMFVEFESESKTVVEYSVKQVEGYYGPNI